jgi:hypothetical protein
VQSISLGEHNIASDDENLIRRVIDPEVLSVWFIGENLFPRLHRLQFSNDFLHSLAIPSITALIKNIFTAANLTVLNILTHKGSVIVFEDAIEGLLRNCSSLEKLALMVRSENGWTNLLGTMLSHTTHLCSLTAITPISYTILLRLADFPYLSSLRAEKIVGIPEGPLKLPYNSFRQLRHLHLRDSTPSATLTRAILRSVASGCLTECFFYFGFDTSLRPQDIQDVLQQLVQHTDLTRVYIYIPSGVILGDVKSPAASATFFRSLHSLPKLKYLTFGCLSNEGEFPIDNTIVTDLTQACPKLRKWVALGKRRTDGVVPFHNFLDMLRRHPDLEELPISVDASVLPSAELKAEFGRHKYGPCLTVEDIKETAGLEEVILQLFPRVRILSVRQQWRRPRMIAMSTAAEDVTNSDSDA